MVASAAIVDLCDLPVVESNPEGVSKANTGEFDAFVQVISSAARPRGYPFKLYPINPSKMIFGDASDFASGRTE